MAIERTTILGRLAAGILIGLGGGLLLAAEVPGAAAVASDARHVSGRDAVTRQRRIVVSLADRKLAVFEEGRLARTFEIAVGKAATPSPVGEFVVVKRVKNPTWYGPEGPVPPGPKNPVGTRWIGLSAKGYGIHGTNAPASIGKAASKGCIRMHRDDVEDLFLLVSEGDPVELVAEPTGMLARAFRPSAPTEPGNLPSPANTTKPTGAAPATQEAEARMVAHALPPAASGPLSTMIARP